MWLKIMFPNTFSILSPLALCLFIVSVMACISTATVHAQGTDTLEAKIASDKRSERYLRGLQHLQALDEQAVTKLEDLLKNVAREMVEYTVAFAYGDVYADPRLDPQSRQVATIAALTSLGNADPQLRFHVNAALNLGMQPAEIVEVLYITTVFAGFPAGLNGVFTVREVFEARGIKIAPPQQPPTGTRREKGEAALRVTSGASGQGVLDSLKDIAPDLGHFILDFAYGDIISRQGISPKWKEIAMIAAAAARGTMAPQLAVHLHAALNVGCSKQEIAEVIKQMAVYAGFPAALNAAFEFKKVLAQREAASK